LARAGGSRLETTAPLLLHIQEAASWGGGGIQKSGVRIYPGGRGEDIFNREEMETYQERTDISWEGIWGYLQI
jgi:hypothetical protein